MAEHQNKLNALAVISGIATIIAVLTFFFKGLGSIVIAQKDIDDLKTFQTSQEKTNAKSIEMFATINTNVQWIKDYLQMNVKK